MGEQPFKPGIHAAVNHNPLTYKSVLPASINYDIIFLQNLSPANCYAKYVPLNGALPLTLLNFAAANKGLKNVLSWQTSSEINTDYFAVERSENGDEFYGIAKLKSTNYFSINNYRYEDVLNSNAIIYYRLKQTDVDGKYSYSKVISLHQNIESLIQVVPNPASKNCTIYFNAVINMPAV